MIPGIVNTCTVTNNYLNFIAGGDSSLLTITKQATGFLITPNDISLNKEYTFSI